MSYWPPQSDMTTWRLVILSDDTTLNHERGSSLSQRNYPLVPSTRHLSSLVGSCFQGVTALTTVSLGIGYPTVVSAPHIVINGFKNLLAVAAATEITFKEAESVSSCFECSPVSEKAYCQSSQEFWTAQGKKIVNLFPRQRKKKQFSEWKEAALLLGW